MKTLLPTFCLCCAAALPAAAQLVAPGSPPALDATLADSGGGNYAIMERGANHKVWARGVWEQDPSGQAVARTNAYTELATGMHYKNEGGLWAEAKEEIEAFAGGAVARQGQTRVIFANNLATAGAIDLQAPDGQRF